MNEWAPILTVAGTVLVALIGGTVTVVQSRRNAVSQIQESLNKGFTTLVDDLRTEVQAHRETIKQLQADIQKCQRRCLRLELGVLKAGGHFDDEGNTIS